MKTRKPTRRAQVRAYAYDHMRREARAILASGEAAYDSAAYRRAVWEESYHYGAARGAIGLAERLGILSSTEAFCLERRHHQLTTAATNRRVKRRSE